MENFVLPYMAVFGMCMCACTVYSMFVYRKVYGRFYGLDRIWSSRTFKEILARIHHEYAIFGNGRQDD